jgi:hypothetical protein
MVLIFLFIFNFKSIIDLLIRIALKKNMAHLTLIINIYSTVNIT